MSESTNSEIETASVPSRAARIGTRGFVFAATGEIYITLARRAARNLRLVHPDAEIDFFTDVPVEDYVFSQVHLLSESWFRPKMEALLRSRFDRTLYLDADTMALADLGPVFDVLDQFDLAACHDRVLNPSTAGEKYTHKIPHAYSTINGGVMAVRKGAATDAFIRDWQEKVRGSGQIKDQPALRELLYESDLRLCILPPGYNLMTFHELRTWWGMFGAPRLIHSPRLHKRREGPGDPTTPYTAAELVGALNARRLAAMLHADRWLNPETDPTTRNFYGALEPAPLRWLRNRAKPIYRKLRYRRR